MKPLAFFRFTIVLLIFIFFLSVHQEGNSSVDNVIYDAPKVIEKAENSSTRAVNGKKEYSVAKLEGTFHLAKARRGNLY